MRLLLLFILTFNLLYPQKIALLIGNDDYSFSPLSNPLNDVDGIYKTLKGIGFDFIKVLKNVSKNRMEDELANFSQRATNAEIALIYFSGHGMQVNNKNYMFPAKTTATKQIHLRTLVDLDYLIDSATSAKYGIVLVDACRNNPLVKYFQNGKYKGTFSKKGLGKVTPTAGQIVIGFATSAGETAEDGNGNMSPYAKALSERLKENDDIRNVLGKVTIDVSKNNKQYPIIRTTLASNVCLTGSCGGVKVTKPIVVQPRRYSLPKYSLTIKPTPSNAKVSIANIKSIYRDGMKLEEGIYRIKVKAEGYKTKDFDMKLEHDTIYPITLVGNLKKKEDKVLQSNTSDNNNKDDDAFTIFLIIGFLLFIFIGAMEGDEK